MDRTQIDKIEMIDFSLMSKVIFDISRRDDNYRCRELVQQHTCKILYPECVDGKIKVPCADYCVNLFKACGSMINLMTEQNCKELMDLIPENRRTCMHIPVTTTCVKDEFFCASIDNLFIFLLFFIDSVIYYFPI